MPRSACHCTPIPFASAARQPPAQRQLPISAAAVVIHPHDLAMTLASVQDADLAELLDVPRAASCGSGSQTTRSRGQWPALTGWTRSCSSALRPSARMILMTIPRCSVRSRHGTHAHPLLDHGTCHLLLLGDSVCDEQAQHLATKKKLSRLTASCHSIGRDAMPSHMVRFPILNGRW